MSQSGPRDVPWRGRAACLHSRPTSGRLVSAQAYGQARWSAQERQIVLANSLSPAEVVNLIAREPPVAVILRTGSLADHTAGLLNSRGIQLAIVEGMPAKIDGLYARIDGLAEMIVIGSLNDTIASADDAATLAAPQSSSGPLLYRNKAVEVYVDAMSPYELKAGILAGATGVGILRTEGIGATRDEPPSLDEQISLYRAAAVAVAPFVLRVRLFDIGGDKLPTWAQGHAEALGSPLGFRGIRAARIFPDVYLAQLQALATIARETRVGIVIPMVTDSTDVDVVITQLAGIADERIRRNLEIGVLVEVPSAALLLDALLPAIDFVRVGPGDLTQFTLAKLRSNLRPEDISGSAFHPAVVRLIEHVALACASAGKPATLCLDIEPRGSLLRQLLQAGVNVFCVSPSNVALTRQRIFDVCQSFR